jgi:hypothetical protein
MQGLEECIVKYNVTALHINYSQILRMPKIQLGVKYGTIVSLNSV